MGNYGSQYVKIHAVAATALVNEVQTITPSATSPDAGTFKLSFGGQTTAALNFNDNAVTVTSALEGLSTIGAGNVVVTGSLATAFTATFGGTLAATDVDMITTSSVTLTKASASVSLTVAQSVLGRNTTDIIAAKTGYRIEIDSLDVLGRALSSSGSLTIGWGYNANDPILYYTDTSETYRKNFPFPGDGGDYTSGLAFTYALVSSGTPDFYINVGYHYVNKA